MKKLAALVVLVVLAALYLGADVVVRNRAESTIATKVEAALPGTSATVRMPSLPFTGHLAVGGDVPSLRVALTGLKVGPFAVQTVTLDASTVDLDRGKLLSGSVVVTSVRSATVTAVLTQEAIDAGAGLPITLGQGAVGVAGLQVPATVSIAGGDVDVKVAGLRTIAIPLLPPSLLPCTLQGTIEPGQLVLGCTATSLPPVLAQAAASA